MAGTLVPVARGDVTYSKPEEGSSQVEVVRMTVMPAAEPVPALRYRLIAPDIDLRTGNAAPYYYRAQLNLHQAMKNLRDKFDEDKELSRWYDTGAEATPIRELPLDKVRKAVQMFDPIYNDYLKPAFEVSGCDWELGIEQMRGPEMVSFLLPEFQDSRQVARMLCLRTRLAIAEHRYDDAVEMMQQQYRLGRDVTRLPLLVCGLIGIAIDGLTNGTLIDLIASPDSPNMYWALGQLPDPLVDLRPAARIEMEFGPRMFPLIQRPETTERSPAEWNRLFTRSLLDMRVAMGSLGMRPSHRTDDTNVVDGISATDNVVAGIAATGLGLIGYTHAKERLVAEGMDRQRVEKMAVGQVIAIYTERVYRRFADDEEKLWYMPFPEMQKANDTLDRRIAAAYTFGGGQEREILPLVAWLMPAMSAVRIAQVRLDRDTAAIRVIEALRMHAAKHHAHLPKTLDEIDIVTVPLNPATGKPFLYRLEGKTAVLELPASDHTISGNRRYEIQIAANK
jgi:hypothetical protein